MPRGARVNTENNDRPGMAGTQIPGVGECQLVVFARVEIAQRPQLGSRRIVADVGLWTDSSD